MKLKEAWGLLRSSTTKEDIQKYQKEINNTEQWCINNGFAGITKLTDWSTYKHVVKKQYRYEGIRDGGWNIPDKAFVGKDRCGACKYNNASYCDLGVTKPCIAKV